MSADEKWRFEALPQFDAAVRLRRWDEAAKVVGLKTPDLQHFVAHLEQAQRRESP